MTPGKLYIVSAPSGAGKTSMLKALMARKPELNISVSHTTRQPRPGEEHGINYFFVSKEEFEQAVARNEFFEYAEVFGNYYGTSRTTIQNRLDVGKDVILEIDWQGARKVREQIPDAVSIFVLPPSLAALESRLHGRQQDSHEVVQRRMAQARSEMIHYAEYDYIIVNDEFERAVNELEAVFVAEGLKLAKQQQHYNTLLAELLGDDESNLKR